MSGIKKKKLYVKNCGKNGVLRSATISKGQSSPYKSSFHLLITCYFSLNKVLVWEQLKTTIILIIFIKKGKNKKIKHLLISSKSSLRS